MFPEKKKDTLHNSGVGSNPCSDALTLRAMSNFSDRHRIKARLFDLDRLSWKHRLVGSRKTSGTQSSPLWKVPWMRAVNGLGRVG